MRRPPNVAQHALRSAGQRLLLSAPIAARLRWPSSKCGANPAPSLRATLTCSPPLAAGNAFFKKKQHLKAAGCYTKAARKDPTNPVYQSNLAAALIGLAKFDKAIKASEACIKLDAANEKGHYRRACALLGAERFDEAVVEFEETTRINGDNKEAKKKVVLAARGALKQHKEAGTEPPEAVAKYKKVKSEEEVAATEARREKAKQERMESAQFKFPKGKEGVEGAAAAADGAGEGAAGATQAPAGDKPTAQSELFSTEGSGDVSKPEEIDAAMQRLAEGDEVPYQTERVARFMALEIAELCKPENAKSYAFPIAIFLPGTQKDGWGDEGQGVGMRACFDSATTHQNAVPFLRQYATKTAAHAMLMVSPKSQIAFPQVWKRKDKPWPYGDSPGYFVQLDARKSEDRRLWFIEVLGKEDAPEYRRHMLDESMYSFIQPVLKPIVLDTPNVTRDFAADRALQGNVSATPPEPEPEVPVSAEDFSASESFDGAREGWLFKSGPNGTGYYRDAKAG